MTAPPPSKRRRNRWGDTPFPPADPEPNDAASRERGRRRGFSSAPAGGASAAAAAALPSAAAAGGGGGNAKAKALQSSIAARLAALKARKAGGAVAAAAVLPAAAPIIASSKRPAADEATGGAVDAGPRAKKARVFELDMSATAPTYKKEGGEESTNTTGGASEGRRRRRWGTAAPEAEKKKKKAPSNPYLAHAEPEGEDEAEAATAAASAAEGGDRDSLLDARLQSGRTAKSRPRHRPLTFVEPGHYVEIAERRREKAENAEKSGFVSGRKEGTYVKGTGMGVGVVGGTGGVYGEGEAGLLADDKTPLVPRADCPDPEDEKHAAERRDIPYAMEWWDVDLLPGKLKKELASREASMLKNALGATKKKKKSNDSSSEINPDKDAVADEEGKLGEKEKERDSFAAKCYSSASLSRSKTSSLVQHPAPFRPPGSSKPASQPTLHLTKREIRRQRKLRRAERARDLQDMQAAGLVPPPEPRLTLSNFMRVLGDQAVLDPSAIERRVEEQVQARKIKHEKMNADRKLTREQRREKRARKLAEDTAGAVSVALFLVRDMAHPYHRTKVDLNAQQNSITGGVLECSRPEAALVVAEGGPRAIKRFTRLMTVRMRWRGEDLGDGSSDEDEEEVPDAAVATEGEGAENGDNAKPVKHKFNPRNACELLWTGMAPKRAFHNFAFQKAESSVDARKVLEARGCDHFWDLALARAGSADWIAGGGGGGSGGGSVGAEGLRFKLGGGNDDDDGDEVMEES